MADLAQDDEPVFAGVTIIGAFDLILLAICLTVSSALSGIVGMFDHCRLCRVDSLGLSLQFHGTLQALLSTRSKLDYNDVALDRALLRDFTPSKTHRGRCQREHCSTTVGHGSVDLVYCDQGLLLHRSLRPE